MIHQQPQNASVMLDFTSPAVRIEQVIKLIKKTKGNHPALIKARASVWDFKANGTSVALYGAGKDAETAYKLTQYSESERKAVPAVTDKNIMAELEAIALIGCIVGPSWANGSSPETFRDTLNDACILIDSTSYNERPY